jgi:hypothetical protein
MNSFKIAIAFAVAAMGSASLGIPTQREVAAVAESQEACGWSECASAATTPPSAGVVL